LNEFFEGCKFPVESGGLSLLLGTSLVYPKDEINMVRQILNCFENVNTKKRLLIINIQRYFVEAI
jgi:hypothetical protein